jgi:subtilase family serine protease
MRRRTLATVLLAAGLAVVPAVTASAQAPATHGERRVCANASAGFAACHAHVRTLVSADGKVTPDATSGPTGYSPSQLRTAYGLLTAISTMHAAGTHPKVAIVDAYASPNAAADLATYRSLLGIPAVHSFVQDNQAGTVGNTSWGQEEMLDLEMVSAICPDCDILYAGAASASFVDLGAAVNRAVTDGAVVVSNSYGGSESSSETGIQNTYYTHPGVAITVSSGDSGYGVQSPAAFNTVTAVGGTTLKLTSGSTRSSETVWSGAGSGCSSYISKPSWQGDSSCARRTVADVAADADPATGVSVYDSYGSTGGNNWYVFGGTSVAAPIIGAVYALSGNTGGTPASLAYTTPAGSLYDVTSGSNTRRCRAGYLCSGAVGYDGPTGMGTPIGVGAF